MTTTGRATTETDGTAPLALPQAPGLRLRYWEPSDAPAVLGAFATPEMARQSGRPVTTLAEAATWITDRRAARETGREHSFAVLSPGTGGHPDEGRLLGNVTVGAVDPVHQTGWISYWTLASARGRGVATTALRALADWSFTELSLFRLELGHRTQQPRLLHRRPPRRLRRGGPGTRPPPLRRPAVRRGAARAVGDGWGGRGRGSRWRPGGSSAGPLNRGDACHLSAGCPPRSRLLSPHRSQRRRPPSAPGRLRTRNGLDTRGVRLAPGVAQARPGAGRRDVRVHAEPDRFVGPARPRVGGWSRSLRPDHEVVHGGILGAGCLVSALCRRYAGAVPLGHGPGTTPWARGVPGEAACR
ncbi:RimJ/RimL family protein N-acetyltransferase [Streptomyces sp. CZ24]|nr:RimJ/RimL family protein N-acetyltransferase [Streptomyces sp. CZ24]